MDEQNLFNAKFDTSSPNQPQTVGLVKVSGEIVRVVYVSEDETYSVIKIRTDKGDKVTVTGAFSGAFEGQIINVKGKWENHKTHGKQLRATQFNFELPITAKGIERYLASGLISGIGEKRAKLIVSYFKENTLEILSNHSARLLEIPGFGKKTLKSLQKSWKEHEDKREIIVYFQSLGISLAYCQKIHKRFGNDALNIVKNNPYKLAEEVTGIGFLKADNIAKNLGIQHNDLKRMCAGISYALGELSQAGHVCYPEQEFLEYTSELLEVDTPDIERGIVEAAKNKNIVIDTINDSDNCEQRIIYSFSLFLAEKELSEIVPKLAYYSHHKGEKLAKIRSNQNYNIVFNKEQHEAIRNVSLTPISIITGGPGVGKTTVISEIVNKSKIANLKISLAAPTGRAAKRMSESTGIPAFTIHRLLKWEPISKAFAFNQNNKLPTDILVVDEVSMLDIQLAASLFKAIAPGTTIILVGDADQLPSVGPGSVLHNLINSSICPITRLVQIYRQDPNSRIVPNAHAINAGRMIDLSTPENQNVLRDFYWIDQEDAVKASELIVKMVKERIPKRFRFHPFRDIQVLSPMTKGDCGTKKLNEQIQKAINPGPCPQFEIGNRIFKANDKVMQIKNNYDKKVFNGDIGFVHNINVKEKQFSVKFDDNFIVTYDYPESEQLVLAYAVTIHKSQGSEFPAVIVPCLTSHFVMLQRNLIYTAITRAKKLLILIGSKKAVAIATKNYRLKPRYTVFLQRLQNNIKKYKTIEF